MISEQTIKAFFKGTCSPADAAAVHAYLELHPEILEEYLSVTEWEQFETKEVLPAKLSGASWTKIAAETIPSSTRKIPLYWKRIAVAASLALLIGLSWYLLHITTFSPNATEKELAEVAPMKKVSNTSGARMVIYLNDSSVVTLAPGSELTYPETFAAEERRVILHGEALFSVARIPHHPFRVVADSLITEVLGTKFTVRSFVLEDKITVSLHEGKVRVTPAGLPFSGEQQAYQLVKGDELFFDKRSRKVMVNHQEAENISTSSKENTKASTKKGVAGNNWYMFHNQSLPEVLEQLSRIYRTPIHYNKKDLQGLTFIGKIDRTDSLESVLRSIALLNQLQLHTEDTGYRFSK